jgi:hypothetical protein
MAEFTGIVNQNYEHSRLRLGVESVGTTGY